MQTPTNTTTNADLMAPARVVFNVTDGCPAVEGIMSPARAHALLALTEADTNKRTVRQSDGIHYGCGTSKPSARDVSVHLLHLADLLSSLAHVLRSARWQNQPAPRLRDEFSRRMTGAASAGHGTLCLGWYGFKTPPKSWLLRVANRHMPR